MVTSVYSLIGDLERPPICEPAHIVLSERDKDTEIPSQYDLILNKITINCESPKYGKCVLHGQKIECALNFALNKINDSIIVHHCNNEMLMICDNCASTLKNCYLYYFRNKRYFILIHNCADGESFIVKVNTNAVAISSNRVEKLISFTLSFLASPSYLAPYIVVFERFREYEWNSSCRSQSNLVHRSLISPANLQSKRWNSIAPLHSIHGLLSSFVFFLSLISIT